MASYVNLPEGTVRILDDSVLERYNSSIQTYNQKARETLGQFNKANGELTGFSPLMAIQLIDSNMLPAGTSLATRNNLEKAASKNNSFLKGNYTGFGLALRTKGDSYKPNNLLAKRLAEQLKKRDIALGTGKLIPLDVLSLSDYKNSAYGVVLDLKEEAESSIRDLNDFKWDFIRDEGFSRARFGGDRYWDSCNVRLADSYSSGRVVVFSAEGTAQNFLEKQN